MPINNLLIKRKQIHHYQLKEFSRTNQTGDVKYPYSESVKILKTETEEVM